MRRRLGEQKHERRRHMHGHCTRVSTWSHSPPRPCHIQESRTSAGTSRLPYSRSITSARRGSPSGVRRSTWYVPPVARVSAAHSAAIGSWARPWPARGGITRGALVKRQQHAENRQRGAAAARAALALTKHGPRGPSPPGPPLLSAVAAGRGDGTEVAGYPDAARGREGGRGDRRQGSCVPRAACQGRAGRGREGDRRDQASARA